MKHSLRIIIVIVLIVVLAFCAWLIFLKPSDNLSTYQQILEVLEYKSNQGINKDLCNIKTTTGYGLDYSIELDRFDKHQAIMSVRDKIFAFDAGDRISTGSFVYYGYTKYDSMLADAANYYLAYAKLASNPTRAGQTKVKNLVDKYKESIDDVANIAQKVLKSQKNYIVPEGMNDNLVANSDLTTLYKTLRSKYRVMLTNFSELIRGLKEFVVDFCFETYYNSALSVMYDSMVYSVQGAMMAEEGAEVTYLNDLTLLIVVCENYLNNAVIFTGSLTEMEYISSFSNLYKDYEYGLEYIFSLTHDAKLAVLFSDESVLSNIRTEFQQDCINVLTILGL